MADHRVNLLVASATPSSGYGGVQTAVDLFRAVASSVDRGRVISIGRLDAEAIAAFPGFRPVSEEEDVTDPWQLVSVASAEPATIPVGPRDVFIATFWPTTAFVLDARRWQEATYGRAPGRFAYLIQDFEPAFYPRSAQAVLARATYDSPASTIAIFNTTLLQNEFHRAGIEFGAEYVFEPRLAPSLAAILTRPAPERSRTIVVYGRPSKPRNAFPYLVEGLRAWRASYRAAGEWSVVSAGEEHVDVDLGSGLTMRSLGKLDISTYGELLRGSAIGVSFMISSHPSYPPLEMAQLGLLVLTNRFEAKDLSTWHSNISSLRSFTIQGFENDLAELCQRFESDPTIGERGRLLRPDFVDEGPQFPFAREIETLLRDS